MLPVASRSNVPSTVQGSIVEYCTFNTFYAPDTNRPVSQETFRILDKIKNISIEEFVILKEIHYFPSMEACLSEAIYTNNLVILDYICINYPSAMNVKYNYFRRANEQNWKKNNPQNWVFKERDSDWDIEWTALAHAFNSGLEFQCSDLFRRLLQHGANPCPINKEENPYTYNQDRDNNSHPIQDDRILNIHDRGECDCVGGCDEDESDEYLSDSELQLINPLLRTLVKHIDFDAIFSRSIALSMECLELAIRFGAKKCYTYNILSGELEKEKYFVRDYEKAYQQAKNKFLSTKVKIAFISVWQTGALGFVPRDVIHYILTDKVITPYHKRVTQAKREIRLRPKQIEGISTSINAAKETTNEKRGTKRARPFTAPFET